MTWVGPGGDEVEKPSPTVYAFAKLIQLLMEKDMINGVQGRNLMLNLYRTPNDTELTNTWNIWRPMRETERR